MKKIALVTDSESLPIDYDMTLLFDACHQLGMQPVVCHWNNNQVDWSVFDIVIPRSTWTYVDHCNEFLSWCNHVTATSVLLNPVEVIHWNVNKNYLQDLEYNQVPIVPSVFSHIGDDAQILLNRFYDLHGQKQEIVVKPALGAYSKNVRRFSAAQGEQALKHINQLIEEDSSVIVQPYFKSIDIYGETNLIYFDGEYSHSIKKEALLMADGRVKVPHQELRKARLASEQECEVASAALNAIKAKFSLDHHLLYARIDLIHDDEQQPRILELELMEPSLSLPFTDTGAKTFATAIARRLQLQTNLR
ncbi:ATP-grasp domain-containing protein [Xenorhabdus eapokensis]|uniref:Cycloserine biosynthesis protein DcsG n=1 Tax=Xenorhabdus eapokensis TaxID=1873482 RepID=A0A1Q5TFR3_9GAMM|nr:hypothetical protein [Xenorhabdus eapokensis]OKO99068.1 Cycloserine biosynthesis protein DcsG [Xenorhabdus eapokensis]